ncbi:MAG TPA: hypothetical protein DC063_00395 [Arenimonas sp.]|nr:MAG: hypothetical protein A2X76_09005 [Xanthomonadales bacterium GWF1_69_6]HBD18700.1 hypothetical protein [Arenimonas sp.]
MSKLRAALLIASLALALPVAAKQEEQPRLQLDAGATRAELAEQRARIEAAIRTDAYAEFKRTDRTALAERLDALEGALPEQGALAELPAERQAWVGSEQEKLNDLLDRAYADSRVTCVRQEQIGSSMRKKVCTTAAQRRRSSDEIRNLSRGVRGEESVGSQPAN